MGWYEESKKRKMSREKIVQRERETYCHHRDIKRLMIFLASQEKGLYSSSYSQSFYRRYGKE
jgi:hypothetical protein